MQLPFIKMNGTGNDFIIFDARKYPLKFTPEQVRAIAARDNETTKGCDQVIILEPAKDADVFMRIYNADGGEVDACGNATRCIGWKVMQEKNDAVKPVTVKTNAGILQCRQVVREDMPPHYAGIDAWIEAHMGAASFKPAEIPVSSAWNDASLANIARELDIDALVKATCVGMGNPHVVFFVSKLPARAVLEMAGDKIKSIPLFMPHGVNLTIAEIGSTAIFSLVFERGAGMTKSCGTAACATGVAAVMLGYRKKNEEILVQQLQRQAEDLFVRWDKSNNQVFLTGPVKKEFEGDVYV